ncbi:hypothetical protein [Brachybacterium sp. UNK5269]|uniref:hypothetical protein n=1 Tax=Brachybacterium sp. UNK5269 TaxID=3408576 RepID=UPI003BAFBB7E
MKIGFFVEGSTYEGNWLERTWAEVLLPLAGLDHEYQVVGISKAAIVALTPGIRSLSSTSEPFDALFERMLRKYSFDAAIVCWDLVPKWNKDASPCRWQETLDFYRLLSESSIIPESFRRRVAEKFVELSSRPYPAQRAALPKIQPGDIVAAVMEPMFESIIADESVVRSALGLHGERPKGWPRRWSGPSMNNPDDVIGAAIAAAHSIRPKPREVRRIGKGFSVAKNEWGYYLLQFAVENNEAALRAAPIVARLSEMR